ncbi:MAG: Mut7-C RNAse domain-containing protein [Dehalococcoidia bacterium]|jgi:hypothetical protein|nr:Mut7-C RNAse domain-containing protein [Dehalococcoidia bacterium]MDP7470340.1 Mut7-C RNAse domain-containing protein [Dehalococcoidia bacterium]
MGYDAALFTESDDSSIVRTALKEGRIVLTRDSGVVRRRVATTGRLQVLLLRSDSVWKQLSQVVTNFSLNPTHRSFSLCLECNHLLEGRSKEEVVGLVPPYVLSTQWEFSRCPSCGRIYWKGTHWDAMRSRLQELEVV